MFILIHHLIVNKNSQYKQTFHFFLLGPISPKGFNIINGFIFSLFFIICSFKCDVVFFNFIPSFCYFTFIVFLITVFFYRWYDAGNYTIGLTFVTFDLNVYPAHSSKYFFKFYSFISSIISMSYYTFPAFLLSLFEFPFSFSP